MNCSATTGTFRIAPAVRARLTIELTAMPSSVQAITESTNIQANVTQCDASGSGIPNTSAPTSTSIATSATPASTN